jgi:integrase
MVLLPDVSEELRRLKGTSQADDYIFCGRYPSKQAQFTKAWKNAVANAGLESDVCFHSLRHTHASWLARSGAPLLAIADSLGHKSLAMTKRYSHLCIDSRAEMITKVFAA